MEKHEKPKVKIDDRVCEMDIQIDEHRTYFNKKSGEFVLMKAFHSCI